MVFKKGVNYEAGILVPISGIGRVRAVQVTM